MKLTNQSQFFALVLGTVILVSGTVYYDSNKKVNDELKTYEQVTAVAQAIFELNFLTSEHISTRTLRTQQQWTNRHASLTNLLLIIKKHAHSTQAASIKRIRLNLTQVRFLFFKIIAIENMRAGNLSIQDDVLIKKISTQVRVLTQQIVSDVNKMKQVSQDILNNTENNLTFLIEITLILIGLIFFVIMFWVKVSFLSPILKLKQHSLLISNGNYSARIKLSGKNEIADLSRSFNSMSDTIADKINSLTKTAHVLEQSKKQLEQSILEAESAELRYREIFVSAADCIISINDNGIIHEINPAGEKIFGYTANELKGKNVSTIMPSPDKEKHDSYLEHYKKTGIAKILGIGRQVEGQRKNGSLVPIALSVSEIEIEGVVYYSGVLRDVTQEIEVRESMLEINQQLTTTNKELEAYAYSISHDLRSPLRAIDGYSMILLEDFSEQLDEEAKLYLSRIRTGTYKMGELITDLLKMSRITQETLDIIPLDLAELSKEEMLHLRIVHPDRNIEFKSELHIEAHGDKILIQAALENLLNNAVKYTEKQTLAKIELGSIQESDKPTIFFIRDNGVGFNMAHKDKLFKAFQRLHKNKEFEGSGIGLATVQRIIERHNGKIWAESEPEKGATFYFTLNVTYDENK